MKRRAKKRSVAARDRCSGCGQPIAGYEAVNYGSIEEGYRQLCWRCFNTEVARSEGLERFEHISFELIRLADCDGRQHDFHFRVRLFGPGVALDAFELHNGTPAGYQFQVIGEPEGDLFELLGRLLEKIRRALAVKH